MRRTSVPEVAGANDPITSARTWRDRHNRRVITRQLSRAAPFVGPYLVHLIVFGAYPIVLAMVMTFFEWPPIGEGRRFIGIQNYVTMAGDPVFWASLWNIGEFLVLNLTGVIILAILLGLAFNQKLPFMGVLRTACFSPSITSLLVIAIVWSWLYAPIGGLINYGLHAFGIPDQMWLNSPSQAMPAIALMSIWRGAGFYGVIILTGLQSIPHEIHEAAQIDGANHWQSFWRITLPLLNPTIELVIVLATIWGFLLFTEPYIMTQGGPLNRTMTVAYYMYLQAFQYWKLGYAAAIGAVFIAIIFTFTMLERRFIGRRIEY